VRIIAFTHGNSYCNAVQQWPPAIDWPRPPRRYPFAVTVLLIAVVLSWGHVFSIIIRRRRLTNADERFGHDCLTPLDVGSRPDRYLLAAWRWSCDNFVGLCLGWTSAMLCSVARPCVLWTCPVYVLYWAQLRILSPRLTVLRMSDFVVGRDCGMKFAWNTLLCSVFAPQGRTFSRRTRNVKRTESKTRYISCWWCQNLFLTKLLR